ncbi:M55 family metallopeptidase [Alkalihalobacillus sp. MEB130]|uniref:M55 family metallopeptidase n=1 Tax=Alkalihalobacillus sp. MEB130 TaxID=2976704 RepID=UPI0028DD6118|nr:M55 family metallopeptidase [Alkalihalobacillus sp. MEB130]MDT8861886.1 M55 family metallopeptidase [Alkalihalobacillus sp. MEB130]
MKIFVSADMEGITGLVDETFVDSSKHNYKRGQEIMTAEVNSVVDSLHKKGCKEIIVNDSHSKMNNILIEKLHPEALLISGDVKPFSMVQGLDETCSGAIFVGYHARASMKGVLSHSMTFGARQMFIDDILIGELGFNAFVAGYYDVPVIMVAGDDQAALEAEALIEGVTTAVVKKAISRTSALCLTPEKSRQLLEEKTEKALENIASVQPLKAPKSPTLRIEFANYGQAEWANLMPGTEIESGTTVRFQAKDVIEAYQAMVVMTELASRTKFC